MSKKKVYLPIILIFLFAIFLDFKVYAKEININSLDVNSKLLEDGSLYIEEVIGFKMSGDFNGVYREINTKYSGGVQDIKVTELTSSGEREFNKVEDAKNGQDGIYQILKSGDIYNLKIYSPAKDTNKKFKIYYKLKNVAVKYNDIGELRYRFWGDQSENTIDKFNINLTIEKLADRSKLQIFSRGPIDTMETSIVDSNVFNIKGERVKAKTPIEGRFLFPKETIPLSTNIVGENALNRILEEESANQKAIEDEKNRKKYIRSIGNIIGPAAFVLNLILGAYILKIKRNKIEDDYNAFPDDCTPAIASKLYKNIINERDVIATILDLIRKKYLCMKDLGHGDYVIIKNRNIDDNLLSHEKFAIRWFIDYIGNGVKVELGDIENYSKEHRDKFFDYFYKWKVMVKHEFDKKGYYDKNAAKLAKVFVSIFVTEIAVMVIFLAYGSLIFIIGLITALFNTILSFSLWGKKSVYGENQLRRWKVFKKYLDDNRFIKDQDLNSIETIDKYLVYAVSLGVNDRIFEKLNIKFKDKGVGEESYYDSCLYWYYWLDMNNEHNIIQDSLYNSSSSGTSDGGGYSSGDSGGCAGGGGAGGF